MKCYAARAYRWAATSCSSLLVVDGVMRPTSSGTSLQARPVRTSFRPHPSSVGAARRFVADVLLNRDFPEACIERAVLLVSEVMTNALEGASSHVELVVLAEHPMVRVEIHSQARVDITADSPYRLRLLSGLAEDWRVEQGPTRLGQFAWFEVRA